MPFDFLRKRKGPTPDAAPAAGGAGPPAPPVLPGSPGLPHAPGDRGSARPAGVGVHFDGLTEDWRLTGTMHIDGRLSDALNRRQAVTISEVQWAPIDGSGPLEPAPGLQSIDPYDLIAVLAGPDTLPDFTDEEKAARRVRKEPYQVVLEAPPFRILGTVHVFPGSDPQQMLDQAPEMFVPLTNAIAYVDQRRVADPGVEVVLVNRLYVRGVEMTGR